MELKWHIEIKCSFYLILLTYDVIVFVLPIVSAYADRMIGRPDPQERGQWDQRR